MCIYIKIRNNSRSNLFLSSVFPRGPRLICLDLKKKSVDKIFQKTDKGRGKRGQRAKERQQQRGKQLHRFPRGFSRASNLIPSPVFACFRDLWRRKDSVRALPLTFDRINRVNLIHNAVGT